MKFSELVNINELHELCKSFTSVTGAVTAILDLDGTILTATGWQDICTCFHRVHPVTAGRCRESDTVLAGRLGKGVRYNVYKCRNGLIDVAVPITIGGEHVANFFTGQFFFEQPDKEYYIRQAEEFGFDKELYIEALNKVPIFSEDKVRSMTEFFTRLAQLIGEMGLAGKNLEDANAELHKHQEHLEELVMERTAELSGANRELQTEIAERKRAESELREREERFRATFNQSAVGIVHIAPDGQWLRINQRFCEIVGYSEEELMSLSVLDITHPDDVATSRQNLELLLEGKVGSYSLEKRYIRKDGSTVWVNLNVSMVSDPDGIYRYHIGVVEDITERKRAEEALRESEALIRVIFDQAFQLMGLMKPDGTLIKMNRTAADFVEDGESEVLDKPFWDTPWWTHSPEQQERLREAVKRAARGEFVRFEATHLTPAGEVVWVDFSLKPVTDENGTVFYLVPEGRDITERKRAEKEVESLNTYLADQAAELEAANQELEAFNYTVAHDLRKPLTVVNGYCQAIKELCGFNLDETCKGYLQEAYDGTLRMNRLIDTLLNFSRLTDVELHRGKVELGEIAKAVAAELHLAEPARRVTFRIAEGGMVNGDASLLKVVLDNLLGNAWKYTGQQEEVIIEFGLTEIDGKLACFVRDNGPGFDKADAEKLFIPFQRLPGTGEFKGHGIGLATVERIIKRHGGKVWAEGEPGKGATFYFTLGNEL